MPCHNGQGPRRSALRSVSPDNLQAVRVESIWTPTLTEGLRSHVIHPATPSSFQSRPVQPSESSRTRGLLPSRHHRASLRSLTTPLTSPLPLSGLLGPAPNDSDQWELKIPVSIRDYRDVTSVEEYIDLVEHLVAPPEPPIGTLIRLRTIRHAIEHGDARAKAVAAYARAGPDFSCCELARDTGADLRDRLRRAGRATGGSPRRTIQLLKRTVLRNPA